MHPSSLRRSALLVLTLLSACAAADPGQAPGPSAGQASAQFPELASGAAMRGSTGVAAAYLIGRYAARQNDLEFAADQFIRALKGDPDNPELQQQAFLAALMAGRPEANQLAGNLQDNQAAALLLANTEARAGHWASAQAKFTALPHVGLLAVLQPLAIAWCQAGAGQFDAASETLKPYLAAPQMRAVYTLHAALIADLGRRPGGDAGRLYQQALVDYGGSNLELGRMIASWQARNGQMDAAHATIATMVEGSADLAMSAPALQAAVTQPVIRNAADGLAESYLALAAALHAQNANDFAAVLLRLALDLRPDLTPARLLDSELLAAARHPDAALRMLQPVAVNEPLSALVRQRQAVLMAQLGDNAGALKLLEQLAVEFPNRPEPPAIEGDLLRADHKYTEAVKAYDRAVALLGPPARINWPLFYDRGVAFDRAHEWAKAEADLLTALALSPEQPVVLNYLGYSWTEQGINLPRARQMLERAVEQRPNDGAIIDSLGWVVLRQGDVPGAVKYLERAVELEPEDASINAHLGDAYLAAGRRLEAQFQWRRSLNLNPDPDDLVKLQEKLRDDHAGADRAIRAQIVVPQTPVAVAAPGADKTLR